MAFFSWQVFFYVTISNTFLVLLEIGQPKEVGQAKDPATGSDQARSGKKAADECVWGTSFRKPMFAKVSVWLQRKKHKFHFEAHLQCL